MKTIMNRFLLTVCVSAQMCWAGETRQQIAAFKEAGIETGINSSDYEHGFRLWPLGGGQEGMVRFDQHNWRRFTGPISHTPAPQTSTPSKPERRPPPVTYGAFTVFAPRPKPKPAKVSPRIAYQLGGSLPASVADPLRRLQREARIQYKKLLLRTSQAGFAVLLASLIAQYFLYRANKQHPRKRVEAQEHLLKTIEALPASHFLHKLDWQINDEDLLSQVTYLLEEHKDTMPDEAVAALERYRDNAHGPSRLRRLLTHGATIASLLVHLYGEVNSYRLSSYIKGLSPNMLDNGEYFVGTR